MTIINFVGHGYQSNGNKVSIFNPGSIRIFVEEGKVNKSELKKDMKEYAIDALKSSDISLNNMRLLVSWTKLEGDKGRARNFSIPFSKVLSW